MSDEKETPPIHRDGLVWCEFKGHRRDVFSNPFEFPFRAGDIAIVESDRGHDAGKVKHVLAASIRPDKRTPEYKVIRKATFLDKERLELLSERERQAVEICGKKIKAHQLPMTLIDTEYRFDGLKLIFYFTAEGRVDFRELVRDLASAFRTRIELRQIGARDELRRWEGHGVCGCPLCCGNFLANFQPITTYMAKVQNLILNPSKLSGLCSRLKCCLAFEFADYEKELADQPQAELRDPDFEDTELDDMSD